MGKRRAVAFAAMATIVTACNPVLVVDQRGVYTTEPVQSITGSVALQPDEALVSVTVNGEPATVDGDTFAGEVALDSEAVFNRVLVVATLSSGRVVRERRTVVHGDGGHATLLPTGTPVARAAGVRLTAEGLAELADAAEARFGPTTGQVPAGTQVFTGCSDPDCAYAVWLTVGEGTTSAAPQVELSAGPGAVGSTVTTADTVIPVVLDYVRWPDLTPGQCSGALTAGTVTVTSAYGAIADPADPAAVSVEVVTPPEATVTPVADAALAACPPVAEHGAALLAAATPGLAGGIEQAHAGLGTQDPVAATVDDVVTALAAPTETAPGPVVAAEARWAELGSDVSGLVGVQDVTYSATAAVPDAPHPSHSVAWGEDVSVVADGADREEWDVDLVLGWSVSGLNQLLAAGTRQAALARDIDVPAGVSLLGLEPFDLRLRAEVAPALRPSWDGRAFPDLALAGYRVTFEAEDDGSTLLEVVLDGELPAELVAGTTVPPQGGHDVDSGTAIQLLPLRPGDVDVTVAANPQGLPEADVVAAVRQVLALTGLLTDQDALLPGPPLPVVPGFDVQPIETTTVGGVVYAFLDLLPATPPPSPAAP